MTYCYLNSSTSVCKRLIVLALLLDQGTRGRPQIIWGLVVAMSVGKWAIVVSCGGCPMVRTGERVEVTAVVRLSHHHLVADRRPSSADA